MRLELEWIVREQADVARLSDEKLAVYNAVLKEQVTELEEALQRVGEHPRFAMVQRHREQGPLAAFGLLHRFDGPAIRARLREISDSLAHSIRALRSGDALAEVRMILEVHEEVERS